MFVTELNIAYLPCSQLRSVYIYIQSWHPPPHHDFHAILGHEQMQLIAVLKLLSEARNRDHSI